MRSKILRSRIAQMFALSFLFSFPVINAQVYDSVLVREVSPGVIHKRIVLLKDTVIANVLKIDMSRGDYYLKAVKAGYNRFGRKTTSAIAAEQADSGFNVVAAVNADFFNMKNGEVESNMITEGEFVKAVGITESPFHTFTNIHSQFALAYDNEPVIERFAFHGELILPDKEVYKISKINASADSNSAVLYNHYQGASTPPVNGSWALTEFELLPVNTRSDTLLFCVGRVSKAKGNSEIGKNSFVLSANNLMSDLLKDKINKGDTLKVMLKLNPGGKKIRTLAGGWPKIVNGGKNIGAVSDSIEGTFPRFSKARHPRTGIGFDEKKSFLYLIVVDGRQTASRGMSLEAFAGLMINEGVYEGLNFDGGGSTAMVVNGKIVNHPSDKDGERAVGNCLLLIGINNTL